MKTKNILLIVLANIFLVDTFAQTVITLRPDATTGKDAVIYSCAPCGYNNQNYGSEQDLSAIAWTNSSNESNGRGLIEFDLSTLPTNSTIISAKLSLYYNSISGNGSHSSQSGPNTCLLQRVTQSWSENTVTWDNQPTTTDTNEIILPQSSTTYQNYPDIDVTALLLDMINNPTQNFGFMLKLETESYYRRLIFSSSDHADTTLHPKLEITYTPAIGIEENKNTGYYRLYPNPSDGKFAVSNNDRINSIEIYNVLGEKVYSSRQQAIKKIDLSNFPKGIYFGKIYDGEQIYTEKIVIQ